MRRRVNAYLKYIDSILSHDIPVTSSFDASGEYPDRDVKDTIPTRSDYERLLMTHLQQTAFFQHERLVHLIVTVLFALLCFMTFCLMVIELLNDRFQPALLALFLLLLVLLVPYIMHYYLLENSVQKMYAQYDELLKQIRR
ncbi:MAG: hypothetical protein IKI75_02455 [Lachnospiraceae bacterium]|nr:hypothetical protein [Lachnospiraceae bacterium]